LITRTLLKNITVFEQIGRFPQKQDLA
jgi:hypothetical protein